MIYEITFFPGTGQLRSIYLGAGNAAETHPHGRILPIPPILLKPRVMLRAGARVTLRRAAADGALESVSGRGSSSGTRS